MRSEGGGWRRQDATEVWYFAEKSSHCLKVDGVTPRRKITSGAASINSLLPHDHSRNHPYPRSEGNSSSIILVPILPPTSLRFSFFLTRLSALPPSGSSIPTLSSESPQNSTSFFAIPSVTQSWRTTSLWNYERQSGIHLHSWKMYIHVHISSGTECYTEIVVITCLRRSQHFVNDTFRRIRAVPNVPYSSTQPRIRPTNWRSANPINQNILKLGPLLGFSAAYPSFLRLHPFNKFSRRERKEQFKEFSRERNRLRKRAVRTEIPSPSSWPLRVS